MVVYRRMNGGEFLQASHVTKAQHRPLSSSKRLVRILSAVVQPAAGFLLLRIADNLHRNTAAPKFVCDNYMRWPKAFHCFS